MFLESRLEEKDDELHNLRGKKALLKEHVNRGEEVERRAIAELIDHRSKCPHRKPFAELDEYGMGKKTAALLEMQALWSGHLAHFVPLEW